MCPLFGFIYEICRLDEILCRLDEILCRLDEIICRLDEILCRLDEILCRLDEILCRLDEILCRLDEILCRLDEILCRLDEIICRLDEILCRLDEIICRLDEILCRLDEILCRLDDLIFKYACPFSASVHSHCYGNRSADGVWQLVPHMTITDYCADIRFGLGYDGRNLTGDICKCNSLKLRICTDSKFHWNLFLEIIFQYVCVSIKFR